MLPVGLLQSPVFPLYDKLTPDNMVSSLQTLFGQLGAGITALEADTPQSWDALLDPYERLGDALNMAWSVVENLQVRRACPRRLAGVSHAAYQSRALRCEERSADLAIR